MTDEQAMAQADRWALRGSAMFLAGYAAYGITNGDFTGLWLFLASTLVFLVSGAASFYLGEQ